MVIEFPGMYSQSIGDEGGFDRRSRIGHTSGTNPGTVMIPAASIYLATSFVWGLLFWMMSIVFMIYQVDVVELDPLQLVLVGTALEVSAFLFEVPTGVVADTYSRKLSVVIGYLVTGLAFVLMGTLPSFIALVIASFLWGIGWTFISGAHQAWLADEIGESEAASLYLKGARLRNLGAFFGIGIGVFLGMIELHYPIIAAGLLFMAWGLCLQVLMPETGVSPESGSEKSSMLQILKEGVGVIRGSSTLLLLMFVGVVFGTFSEGYDRLSTAHLLRDFAFVDETGFSAVVAFGMLGAIGIVISIGAVMLAERYVDTDNAKQIALTLSLVTALIVVAVITFAVSGYIWLAIAMYIILQPLRGVIDPLTMAWFNRNIPSSSRATVISMHSQADALGQMAGGPGVGLIGRELGVRIAITIAGLLLLPALWLYRRALK